MYYPDLTPYTYSGDPEPDSVNVGWLDSRHDFIRGPVPSGFVERLIELSSKPAKQHRGLHSREFCPSAKQTNRVVVPTSAGETVRLGSAEIHVRSKSGKVYAAPTLICHYVEAHGYQPPEEFIEAVFHNPTG